MIVYENVPLNFCEKAAKSAPRQSHRAQKLHTYSVTEVKKGTLIASVRQGVSFFLEHNTKLPTHKGVLSFLGGFGISIAQRLPNGKKNCTIGA